LGIFGLILGLTYLYIWYKNQVVAGKVLFSYRFGTRKSKFLFWFSLLFVLIYVAAISLQNYSGELGVIKLISQVVILLSVIFLINKSSYLIFGEKGISAMDFRIPKDNIAKFEWDKDINQQQYGLKIYRTDEKFPHKVYIPRDDKPEIQHFIKNYGF
jgi:hypothetical protein